ncbi:MAG: hypothetical protein ACOCP4_07285 [Candidatus Woesearchaeota archaeon]
MNEYKSWDDLKKDLPDKSIETIDDIKEKVTLNEIKFLFDCFSKLKNPNEIKKLSIYQKQQEELGAWVEGFLPDQLQEKDKLVIPNNKENSLILIKYLSEQKEENLQAIKKLKSYPLTFNGSTYVGLEKTYPNHWKLTIDTESIKQLIDIMKKDKISYEDANQLANTKANQEMLLHRKDLAYLPGHKTSTEDLTQLILKGQSQKALDLIWKWINPMNFFDMADIYQHLEDYENLIQNIEKEKDLITSEILGTIHEYIKLDLNVTETFGLTVGFGIRGWSTINMVGVNIEYIKDDYCLLLGMIGHEVFHRMQLLIFSNKKKKDLNFEEIVKGPYKNDKDNKLYEVLSYVLLEGTGELIKYDLMGGDDYYSNEKVKEGVHLLNHIYEEIYLNNNESKVDDYLNQGLIATGPFYSLGKALSDILIKKYSKSIIGELLNEGTIAFYQQVFREKYRHLKLKEELVNKIISL